MLFSLLPGAPRPQTSYRLHSMTLTLALVVLCALCSTTGWVVPWQSETCTNERLLRFFLASRCLILCLARQKAIQVSSHVSTMVRSKAHFECQFKFLTLPISCNFRPSRTDLPENEGHPGLHENLEREPSRESRKGTKVATFRGGG